MEGFEEFEDHMSIIMGLSSDSDETMFDELEQHVAAPCDGNSLQPWQSINMQMPPTLEAAALVLADLKKLLYPSHNRPENKVANFSALLQKWLTWMECFLQAFVNGTLRSAAALQTAQFVGKGPYMSRRVRQWSKAFIQDCEDMPLAKYGGEWTKSQIEDEGLKEDILVHLQSLGKYVSAMAIVDYLTWPEIQQHFKLTKIILLATAE
jgi:hypothetical protein